jgi:preprotein translocase subunit SecE
VDPNSPATTEASAERPGMGGPVAAEAGGAAAESAEAAGGGFLAETLAELRKVVWPSRQQLFSESVAVVLMVGLSAAAIAAIDRFYGWIASQVFR